jgi:RND superfamily putative drug exporter
VVVPVLASLLLATLLVPPTDFLRRRGLPRGGRAVAGPGPVRVAGSRAGRAVTLAGMILVLSFAAIALIPILAFRELAFAMCVGLLLDTLISRTLLIPAIVSLLGPRTAGSR